MFVIQYTTLVRGGVFVIQNTTLVRGGVFVIQNTTKQVNKMLLLFH